MSRLNHVVSMLILCASLLLFCAPLDAGPTLTYAPQVMQSEMHKKSAPAPQVIMVQAPMAMQSKKHGGAEVLATTPVVRVRRRPTRVVVEEEVIPDRGEPVRERVPVRGGEDSNVAITTGPSAYTTEARYEDDRYRRSSRRYRDDDDEYDVAPRRSRRRYYDDDDDDDDAPRRSSARRSYDREYRTSARQSWSREDDERDARSYRASAREEEPAGAGGAGRRVIRRRIYYDDGEEDDLVDGFEARTIAPPVSRPVYVLASTSMQQQQVMVPAKKQHVAMPTKKQPQPLVVPHSKKSRPAIYIPLSASKKSSAPMMTMGKKGMGMGMGMGVAKPMMVMGGGGMVGGYVGGGGFGGYVGGGGFGGGLLQTPMLATPSGMRILGRRVVVVRRPVRGDGGGGSEARYAARPAHELAPHMEHDQYPLGRQSAPYHSVTAEGQYAPPGLRVLPPQFNTLGAAQITPLEQQVLR